MATDVHKIVPIEVVIYGTSYVEWVEPRGECPCDDVTTYIRLSL